MYTVASRVVTGSSYNFQGRSDSSLRVVRTCIRVRASYEADKSATTRRTVSASVVCREHSGLGWPVARRLHRNFVRTRERTPPGGESRRNFDAINRRFTTRVTRRRVTTHTVPNIFVGRLNSDWQQCSSNRVRTKKVPKSPSRQILNFMDPRLVDSHYLKNKWNDASGRVPRSFLRFPTVRGHFCSI